MREHTHAGMSLYGSAGSRKYLNVAERRRFAKAALRTPLTVAAKKITFFNTAISPPAGSGLMLQSGFPDNKYIYFEILQDKYLSENILNQMNRLWEAVRI
jgi:hypothetical protein